MADSTLPTAVGMPLLIFYPVEVKISEARAARYRGETIRTATATFYTGPDDPGLPSYPHRVPLAITPASGGRQVVWVFDFNELFDSGEFASITGTVSAASAEAGAYFRVVAQVE